MRVKQVRIGKELLPEMLNSLLRGYARITTPIPKDAELLWTGLHENFAFDYCSGLIFSREYPDITEDMGIEYLDLKAESVRDVPECLGGTLSHGKVFSISNKSFLALLRNDPRYMKAVIDLPFDFRIGRSVCDNLRSLAFLTHSKNYPSPQNGPCMPEMLPISFERLNERM